MSLLVYFHSNGKQASLSNSNQWYVCMYDSIQEETSLTCGSLRCHNDDLRQNQRIHPAQKPKGSRYRELHR